jgi:hypothetical protein
LVLKSELNFGAPITRVEFQSYDTYVAGDFYEFEMRLCHTSLSGLTKNFNQNYGGNTPVLVARASPLTVNGVKDQWFGVKFTTPFEYNNRDNLIVELRWRNQKFTTKVEVWAYTASSNRLLIGKGYNPTEGSPSPKTDRLRITFSGAALMAASLGRVKALLGP